MEIALCLAFMAGIGALALVMNGLHQIHCEVLRANVDVLEAIEMVSEQTKRIEEAVSVQPPLADEKPQAVQVTIKPTAKTMATWMDFEASQKAALDEFKEN